MNKSSLKRAIFRHLQCKASPCYNRRQLPEGTAPLIPGIAAYGHMSVPKQSIKSSVVELLLFLPERSEI